jgi:two-component system sensor histidine kinase VanS
MTPVVGVLDPRRIRLDLVEPFRRGADRIRTDHAGVALGLAIVTSIVQAQTELSPSPPGPAGGFASPCNFPVACAHRVLTDDSHHSACPNATAGRSVSDA